ncbi:hypothetical protein ACFWP2_18700 [Kitasatospora sp. NPDC058444]|uniref:hypothetical protein n=1 Tax=Kitasatospora sp. NPDC058444 TaxID=3346504 RepID=UPI003665839C
MADDRTARLLVAGLGLVFVQTGAGTMPTTAEIPLRVVSVAAFLALVGVGRRWGGREETPPKRDLGRNHWYLAGSAGAAALLGAWAADQLLHTPQAAGPWVAVVVGAYLFVLAALWERPALRLLGGAMALCAVAGLVLAFGGASAAAVGTAAGIVPGALLLGTVWWWSARPRREAGAHHHLKAQPSGGGPGASAGRRRARRLPAATRAAVSRRASR